MSGTGVTERLGFDAFSVGASVQARANLIPAPAPSPEPVIAYEGPASPPTDSARLPALSIVPVADCEWRFARRPA